MGCGVFFKWKSGVWAVLLAGGLLKQLEVQLKASVAQGSGQKVSFENVKGFSQTDLFSVERSERGAYCLARAWSPHHHVSSLLPPAAHLHRGRKDDRSLHPLPRAGPLGGHAGHQSVRSVAASGWRSANRGAGREMEKRGWRERGLEEVSEPGLRREQRSRRLFTNLEGRHRGSRIPLQERSCGNATLVLLLLILKRICNNPASSPFPSSRQHLAKGSSSSFLLAAFCLRFAQECHL